MGDSVPKPVDIRYYMASRITMEGCVSRYASYPIFAMLEYVIIELANCVITDFSSALCSDASLALTHTMLQRFLVEILQKGLTTMLLPYTSVQGILIIAYNAKRNNWHSVVKSAKNTIFTYYS